MLKVGTAVTINGLQGRNDLNGQAGVVVEPLKSEAEQLQLLGRHKVMVWKADGKHELISVKRDNLEVEDSATAKDAVKRKRIDWTVIEDSRIGASLGLHDLALETPLGDIDSAAEFVVEVQSTLGTSDAPMPRFRFSALTKDVILGNAQLMHGVYFCQFDAVWHQLVLEVKAGHGRVFQACGSDSASSSSSSPALLGDAAAETVGVSNESTNSPSERDARSCRSSYIALEWARKEPHADWAPELIQAHSRWGGCKELPLEELGAFIDCWLGVQAAGQALLAALLPSLPSELVDAQEKWQQIGDKGPGSASASPISEWGRSCLDCLSGVTYSSSSRQFASNESWTGGGGAFSVTLPQAEADKLDSALAAVTGARLNAGVIASLLRHLGWEGRTTQNALQSRTQEEAAPGWTLSQMGIMD